MFKINSQNLSTFAGLMIVASFSVAGNAASKQKRCSIAEQLQSSNSAECIVEQTVEGKKVVGKVSVNVVKKSKQVRKKDNALEFETQESDVVEVHTEAGVICSAGDCEKSTRTFDEDIKKLVHNPDGLQILADQGFQEAALEAVGALKETEAQKAQDDLCLEDANGPIVAGAARIQCRIMKMQGMTKDQAAQFWDQNIKSEIANLMKACETPGVMPAMNGGAPQVSPACQQNMATVQALLQHANTYSQNNPYVQASLKELNGYGGYLQQVKALETGIAMTNNNPELQAQYQERLGQLKSQWGTYYQNQGLASQNFGMNYAGTLSSDLQAYQAQLDATYASILNGAGISSTGATTNTGTSGLGRQGRGLPNVVSPWAANNNVTGFQKPVNNGLPTAFPAGPPTGPSAPAAPGGFRIPMQGDRVR